MRRGSSETWTLEELGQKVADALSVDYPGPGNGQVRAVPDPRTIRYYASLGLLDRAAAHRGRTALYGRRHLLQLVAIKRLQAEGRSLQEVQQHLLGLSDDELEAIARLPRLPSSSGGAAPSVTGQPDSGRTRKFWGERPAAAPSPNTDDGSNPEPQTELFGTDLLMLVPLEGAASLLLPAGRLSDDELGQIRAAAGPLLDELRARGLLGQSEVTRKR